MNILKEYQFLLMIMLFSTLIIVINFLGLQQDKAFNNFLNDYKENYTRIKNIGTEDKTIYSVLTVDGTKIRGIENNSLFGKNLFSEIKDLKFIDNYNGIGISGIPEITDPNGFLLSFATNRDLFTNGVQENKTLEELGTLTNRFEQGWSLFEDGYILLSFSDEKTTYEVLTSQIPIGTLISNLDTGKKTIISISLKDLTTKPSTNK